MKKLEIVSKKHITMQKIKKYSKQDTFKFFFLVPLLVCTVVLMAWFSSLGQVAKLYFQCQIKITIPLYMFTAHSIFICKDLYKCT